VKDVKVSEISGTDISDPSGAEEISVPSSQPGTEEISVQSSQPGTEEISVPSSQPGTEETSVPSSQLGTPKVSVSELPEKLVEETEPSSLISSENSSLPEPSGGEENSTAVESETSGGAEPLVNGVPFPIKQSSPDNIQELPSKLMNGDQTISLPNSEKTKDLLKSDSTDSAFEATEELVESDIPEEGRVHLQILDPTNQQYIETSFEPEKSGKMLEDCDNLGMEKLNGLSSPGHKDISIQ